MGRGREGSRPEAGRAEAPEGAPGRESASASFAGTDGGGVEDAIRRLRAVFDHTFQFIGLLDPDGTVLEANRSSLAFAGRVRGEVVGRPFWETSWWLDGEETQVRLRESIRAAAAGAFVRYDVEVLGEGGKRATIDFSLNPVRDEAGAVVMLVAEGRDLGDARRAERELRISREKYAGIVATSADAIITVDESQRIIDFNRGAESIFGWSASEVVGEPLHVLMPDRFRVKHGEHVREFGESGVTSRRMGDRREIVGLRKSGEVFPADASISKLEVGGGRIYTVVLRDITPHKRAESVQAFLARAGGLLASSLDVQTVYTGVAQLAVEFLADCCEIFELDETDDVVRVALASADERREAELMAACAAEDRPFTRHPVWSVLERGEAELLSDLDGPLQSSRAGGGLRLFAALPVRSAMVVPLRPRGRTAGAIAFYSTESHRFGHDDLSLARELAARAAMAVDNARLYRAAREAVTARDDVLAVVSHDLGNPLSAIRIGVSLLLRSHGPDDAPGGGWEHLAGIKQSVEQMERLIRDLLEVKRIEAGHMALIRKRVRPASLVDATVEMMAPLADANGIRIRTSVERPLPLVHADRERLIQALANLVGNAIKFAPADSDVEVRCRASSGEVVFEVADNGPGIDADSLAHIFDRYWQATHTRVEGGLGLGLAIVKGIVQAHGGRVWAESEPGRGTTVCFGLRAAEPRAP